MQLLPVLTLALFCIACSHIRVCLGKPKHQLHHETSDAAKIFDNFHLAVASFDQDNDGDLDCLVTVRTDYDSSVPRATYVWILPGVNGREQRNITYDVVPGASSDQFRFWDKYGDGTVETGSYVYTDYKDCVVMYISDRQDCVLWTSWEKKDEVPETCMQQFEDNCDVVHKTYDKDTCSPFFS